jgi:hypothetical protein
MLHRSRSSASLESDSQTLVVRPRMPKSMRPPPDAQLSISTSGKAASTARASGKGLRLISAAA